MFEKKQAKLIYITVDFSLLKQSLFPLHNIFRPSWLILCKNRQYLNYLVNYKSETPS